MTEIIQPELVCKSYAEYDFGACRIHVISEFSDRALPCIMKRRNHIRM